MFPFKSSRFPSSRRVRVMFFPFILAHLVLTAPDGTVPGAGRQTRTSGRHERNAAGELKGPQGHFRQLVFSPDGKLAAAGLMQGSNADLRCRCGQGKSSAPDARQGL